MRNLTRFVQGFQGYLTQGLCFRWQSGACRILLQRTSSRSGGGSKYRRQLATEVSFILYIIFFNSFYEQVLAFLLWLTERLQDGEVKLWDIQCVAPYSYLAYEEDLYLVFCILFIKYLVYFLSGL